MVDYIAMSGWWNSDQGWGSWQSTESYMPREQDSKEDKEGRGGTKDEVGKTEPSEVRKERTEEGVPTHKQMLVGDWVCPKCGNHVFARHSSCPISSCKTLKPLKICSFFNSTQGCRDGAKCSFVHEAPAGEKGKGTKAVNSSSEGGKGERTRSEDKGKGKGKMPGQNEGSQGSSNRVRSRDPRPEPSTSSTTATAIPAPAQPGPKLEQRQKAKESATPPVQPKKSPPERRPKTPPRQDFTLPTGDTDEEGDPNPQTSKKGKLTVEATEAQWVLEANALLDQKMTALGTACSGIIQKACEEITAFSESTLKRSVRQMGGLLREEMEDIKARLTPPTGVAERTKQEYAEPLSKASAAKKPRVGSEAQDQGKGAQAGSGIVPTTQKVANKIPNAKEKGGTSSVDPKSYDFNPNVASPFQDRSLSPSETEEFSNGPILFTNRAGEAHAFKWVVQKTWASWYCLLCSKWNSKGHTYSAAHQTKVLKLMGNPLTPNIPVQQQAAKAAEWEFAAGESEGPQPGESKETFLRRIYGKEICEAIIKVVNDRVDPRLERLIQAAKLPLLEREQRVQEIMQEGDPGSEGASEGKDQPNQQAQGSAPSPVSVTGSVDASEGSSEKDDGMGPKDDGFRELGDMEESKIDLDGAPSLSSAKSQGTSEPAKQEEVEKGQSVKPTPVETGETSTTPNVLCPQPQVAPLQVKAMPSKPGIPFVTPQQAPVMTDLPPIEDKSGTGSGKESLEVPSVDEEKVLQEEQNKKGTKEQGVETTDLLGIEQMVTGGTSNPVQPPSPADQNSASKSDQ